MNRKINIYRGWKAEFQLSFLFPTFYHFYFYRLVTNSEIKAIKQELEKKTPVCVVGEKTKLRIEFRF